MERREDDPKSTAHEQRFFRRAKEDWSKGVCERGSHGPVSTSHDVPEDEIAANGEETKSSIFFFSKCNACTAG